MASLFDAFTNEFCPPLDSSLVAALLADFEVDDEGHPTSPTQSQINELRSTLRELAAQTDESEFSDLHLTSPTDGSSSLPDFFGYDQTDASSSLVSDTSVSSQGLLREQLRFLQMALPNVPEKRLRDALAQAESDGDDPDLWNVISNILADEAVRDMEERGLPGPDDDDNDVHLYMVTDIIPGTMESRKQKYHAVNGAKPSGKKPRRGYKMTLVDVRQQHHARPSSSPKNAASPWAVVMSMSEQLSSLIPSHPALYFQSYFHSPEYATPYEALRSALGAIQVTSSMPDAEDNVVLFTLLDILLPEYEGMLDSSHLSNLYSDLQLVIGVTRGHSDDALDLVRLLRDLDSDSILGCMEMGIYHSPIQANSSPPSSPPPPVQPFRRVSDPLTEPPPIPSLSSNNKSKPLPPEKNRKLAETHWQTVLPKKTPYYDQPSMGLRVPPPAAGTSNGFKVKGGGNGSGKGGRGDVGELAEYNSGRIKENIRKRNMYFREAQRMWRKGNAKNRGGEVAMYYVERGREFDKLAKKEALDVARARVQAKRRASNEKDTIDLHGTTAAEAIVIVKEELEGTTYSALRPLRIITGRGLHSVNHVSVLKPKVQKALVEDGWAVGVWEGGLIVRGKKAVVV